MDQRLLKILGGKTEDYPHALEAKYPRIFGKIMSLWDAPDIGDYFMELVVDKRGDRAGFPQDVAAEIVHLSLLHAAHHSDDQKTDVWEVASGSFTGYAASSTPNQIDAWPDPPASSRVLIEALGGVCSPEGYLHASESGQCAIVDLFLDAGVGTEIRNERGWTALMLAAFYGHHETLERLLMQDANVFAVDTGGNTALHWAAFAGQVDCATLLLKNHADVDARSNFGWTPLLQAVTRRHLAMVMLLINHGANLNIAAQNGNTALHTAAAAGYTEIIRPLLAHLADSGMKNLDGETAVKLAIKNKHDLAVKLLLSASEQR
ncbi:MAG: hypothetical protein GJU76_08330 [Gallionella sp.]|jgi:ankyrin repeat protein|nr:hypothetical protein [Gallionella sp.]